MASRWYETDNPARTVHLCNDCYAPDSQAQTRAFATYGDTERRLAGWEEVKRGQPEFGWYRPELQLAA